ncbi:Protein YceI [Gammaproteobacteria bacterium]|nr:YceI family protein [Gammaproteobacteria bacterium]CAG0942440.1 Protein YceI [Gammaproteobacteria bacterium]
MNPSTVLPGFLNRRRQGLMMAALAAVALGACAPPAPQQTTGAAAPAPAAAAPIAAPAGRYTLDPDHATLEFRVGHMGLANYVARFTRFKASLQLDPASLAASSIEVTVDPTSIRTDYAGDYKAAVPGTPYASFDEALAQSPKFFDAGQHPQIGFRSSMVEETAPGQLRVTGDLSLLGKTLPVTLDVAVVGSVAAHPFLGRGAIGFSATGTFDRSAFGMTELLKPALVSDAVAIRFDGEFHQDAAQGQ